MYIEWYYTYCNVLQIELDLLPRNGDECTVCFTFSALKWLDIYYIPLVLGYIHVLIDGSY